MILLRQRIKFFRTEGIIAVTHLYYLLRGLRLYIKNILLHLYNLLLPVGKYHSEDDQHCQYEEENEGRTFNQLNYKTVPFHSGPTY